MNEFLLIGTFLFGLLVGSFLNVCIRRIPAEEQIWAGRSHCRFCGKTIIWYDNIPLLSFFVLHGKCRHCKAPIGAVYPLVELANGLLFVACAVRFGATPLATIYALLGSALIVLTVIDFHEMILPDEITLPGISIGVIVSFFVPQLHGAPAQWAGLWAAVSGALVGAGILAVIRWLGGLAFKREAMGLGDLKLMAMVGAFIGVWKVVLVDFLLGPLLGALIGLVLKLKYKQEEIPFGPFLAAGTLVAIFWGDAIVQWYARWLFGT
jgi:leader peptidase (prepilin peptidase)/N-methyltransferase